MPDTQEQIDAEIEALKGIANPRVAELLLIDWPQPDGPIYYGTVIAHDILNNLTLLDQLDGPIELRFPGNQFLDVTRDSGVADDRVDLDFWDGDEELSRLAHTHGEGVRVEVFYYFPEVDLLLSQWWGHLRPPEDADCERFKASAQSGFRSSNLPLPRRAFFTGCQAVFGALLETQAEIDDNDCPYSAHLAGTPTSRFATDDTWLQTLVPGDGWEAADFDDSDWDAAVEQGALDSYPWNYNDGAYLPHFPAGTAAQWIWSHDSIAEPDTQTVYFRKTFVAAAAQALLIIAGDNAFTAFLNGVQVASAIDWSQSQTANLNLIEGETYVLAVEVENEMPTGPGANPGGLIAEVAYGIAGVGFGNLDPDTDLPYISCPRNSRAACVARLEPPGTPDKGALSWLAFDTVVESHVVHETKGPNITVTSRGNETNLKRPLRVIAGERHVRDMDVMAFVVEPNTKHPELGSVKVLAAGSEGPIKSLKTFTINGNTIGLQHLNVRLGERRQAATSFSPNIGNYSGTALALGVSQGDFREATAESLQCEADFEGSRDVRVYSSETAYIEKYSQDRTWWLLHCLRQKRWGYGLDLNRFILSEWVDLFDWEQETVSFADKDGAHFTGRRTTFNAELIERSAQQQITDICLAGRFSLPFPDKGKVRVVPLRRVAVLDAVPVFTDEGSDRNICVDEQGKSTLRRSVISDADLVNRIVVLFDDVEHKNSERPLTFEDVEQQLRAGRAFGDTTRRTVEKTYTAFGVTEVGEASRLGNLILHLGEFDEGGLANNLRVNFTTWYLRALQAQKYGVIKVKSSRLDRYGFEYFRVRTMRRAPDLKVEISAQAYPEEYYEQLESLETPPPILPTAGEVNPGGVRGARPFAVGLDTLSHGDDRITMRLGMLEVA